MTYANTDKFYIDGAWVDANAARTCPVENPATEQPFATLSLGAAADIDRAVAAAKAAFPAWSQTAKQDRLDLVGRYIEIYNRRYDEMAAAISTEMGAPIEFSKEEQASVGVSYAQAIVAALKDFAQAIAIAKRTAEAIEIADPMEDGEHIGPLAHAAQFEKVQAMIAAGIAEGATLVAGGSGRPNGMKTGYYARPTVFSDATRDMQIVHDEIFGPVLIMIPFKDEAETIALANDTVYVLSSLISSGDTDRINRVARQLDAGMVNVNGGFVASGSPFGGYKQSGVGREGGTHGLEEFLETKVTTKFE